MNRRGLALFVFTPVLMCMGQMPAASSSAVASPAASADMSSGTTLPGSGASTAAKKAPPSMPDSFPAEDTSAPKSRGAGWEKRALGAIVASKAQADQVELIFDGDSITDFFPGKAKELWNQRYGKFHPVDFAISGDRTENVVWRLSRGQADGMHPKLIALMIGTNDMKLKDTPEQIAAGVQTIITTYRKKCPDAVILLQAIFPRGPTATDPYRLKVKATNVFLAKMADGSKVIYTDFGDKFLAADGTLSKEIMPDFLHPSAKGYQIWADAIQPLVDKYCGVK